MRRKTRERIEQLEQRLRELDCVIGTSRQALFGDAATFDKLRRFSHHVNNDGVLEMVRPAQRQSGLMERVEKLESQ